MPTPRLATTMCQPRENPICDRAATGSAVRAAATTSAEVTTRPSRLLPAVRRKLGSSLFLRNVELLRDVEDIGRRRSGPDVTGRLVRIMAGRAGGVGPRARARWGGG